MDWKKRRLLEHAGILRRGTPDELLFEGDDEDPFGGGDEEEEDEGGEEEAPAADKEPPEEIPPADFEEYGSPRFLELTNKIQGFFNSAKASSAVGAQTREDYPGVVEPLEDTAEEAEEEPTPAKEEESEAEDEEANESIFLSRRDKNLITEALRLLNEAGIDAAGADVFDMEMFATEFANYMESVDFVVDIQKGLYNFARQMILNNFDKPTEQKFNEMLAMKVDKEYDFLPRSQAEPLPDVVAAGASGDGGGGA